MFAVRHSFNCAAKSKQFLRNYTIRRSFSHSFCSAIGGCRNSERATLFLFVLMAIFLTMRHPLKINCSTANNSTCKATPTASEIAVQIIEGFIVRDEIKNIRQTLTSFFYEWVQSEVDYNQHQRSMALFHYRALMDFLRDVENFQNKERSVI